MACRFVVVHEDLNLFVLCRQIRWVTLMVIPVDWDRRDANVLVWLQIVKVDWERCGVITAGPRAGKLRNPAQTLIRLSRSGQHLEADRLTGRQRIGRQSGCLAIHDRNNDRLGRYLLLRAELWED